jgi:hypothetical protein
MDGTLHVSPPAGDRRRLSPHKDGGFVLVLALLAVVALSLIAVDLAGRSSRLSQGAVVESGLIEAGLAADVGLVRILAALSATDDPLAHALDAYRGRAGWRFGETDVELRLRAESGKVDLLAGELDLIRGVVEAELPEVDARADVLARMVAVRASGRPPRSIRSVLPPALQIGDLAARLEENLTVYSGQSGVDPLSATPLLRRLIVGPRSDLADPMEESVRTGRIVPDIAAGLGSRLVHQRPLYTISAEARLPNGLRARRAALVQVEPGRPPQILRVFQVAPGPAGTP